MQSAMGSAGTQLAEVRTTRGSEHWRENYVTSPRDTDIINLDDRQSANTAPAQTGNFNVIKINDRRKYNAKLHAKLPRRQFSWSTKV
jgi:hypothetical protein